MAIDAHANVDVHLELLAVGEQQVRKRFLLRMVLQRVDLHPMCAIAEHRKRKRTGLRCVRAMPPKP